MHHILMNLQTSHTLVMKFILQRQVLVGCLQAHKDGISSVAEYKAAYDTGKFRIYDEYGYEYNWDAFDGRVLKHNGGILGVHKPEWLNQDKLSILYDRYMPDYWPISHIQGSPQSYKFINKFVNDYFVDSQGYEFDIQYFS